ncbi:hypothetical protein RvY_01903 [Ramazzottius varieornatus]|uniref:Transportin-1 n=1 Tax=Ramazzottius varieornatus TaxID=947166 RepID=A0A1D1UI22_RAMVA|nr:hypothetical protein RvY_01903 [Ramazzottius varieornatus]
MSGALWKPQEAGLLEITQLLKESQSPNTQIQRDVQQKLDQLNHHPDFNNYLIFVLTQSKNLDDPTRSLAGLILKNNVRVQWENFHNTTQELIKHECVASIGDSSPLVRATIGILVTTIVSKGGLRTWTDLLPKLSQCLDSPQVEIVDGAFSTLQKICEDSTELDASDAASAAEQQPLDALLPKFIQFFQHPTAKIRAYALGCVNCYILHRLLPLQAHMEVFLKNLFALAMDTDADVKKQVLRAIVTLLEVQPDILYRDLTNIIGFMLMRTQDGDEQVALEACEFWLSVADNQVGQQTLQPHLAQLVPLLLERMKYSAMDIAMLRTEDEEDEMKPDRPEDIKPRFHKSKTHGGMESQPHAATPSGDHATGGEEEDDDEDDNEEMTEWNLRKCSAAALDVLSNVFHDTLLPVLLPPLKEVLMSPDWVRKESGILALGAIAEGCADGMSTHLRDLIPFLLECLNDPKPLVRSITCWTLSRYASWIVAEDPIKYFQPFLGKLLERLLDTNKKVQEAACSAFATLEEEAGALLSPYLEVIVRTLIAAFRKYQSKNLLILYDAIGTLAESVGQELNRPQYVQQLMEPLLVKWGSMQDNDKSTFPLLECLSSLATAMGDGFMPYVEPVFKRCLVLIDRAIQDQILYQTYPEAVEVPEHDNLIVALDLLSGLTEGIGSRIEPLVMSSNLMVNIAHCIRNQIPEVRQSAFALIGDLARAAFNAEKPYLDDFVAHMALNMDPEHLSVCNNATWALGEVALRLGAETTKYVPHVVEPLIGLMNRPGTQKTLLENAAITLGRLGLTCPQLMAERLPQFIKPWCYSLRNVRDNEEKASAFRGICVIIGNRQKPMDSADFMAFCDAVASWQTPDPQLKSMFQQLLHAYKSMAPADQWPLFMQQFPQPIRERLEKIYGM